MYKKKYLKTQNREVKLKENIKEISQINIVDVFVFLTVFVFSVNVVFEAIFKNFKL